LVDSKFIRIFAANLKTNRMRKSKMLIMLTGVGILILVAVINFFRLPHNAMTKNPIAIPHTSNQLPFSGNLGMNYGWVIGLVAGLIILYVIVRMLNGRRRLKRFRNHPLSRF
jgi:hypothetical protein